MSYTVRIARQAEAYYQRLDGRTQQRILRRLEEIATNPYGLHTKPLTNAAGRRSARVGGWRIIFVVDDDASLVDVSHIGPRGGIYRQV